MSEPRRRRWRKALGYALAFVALGYAARQTGLGFAGFLQALLALAAWQWIACLALFAIHVAMNSVAFSLLMQGMQCSAPHRRRLYRAAWNGSLLAKYVPGGVWQIAGRGLLLVDRGVSARAVVVSGVFEQLVSLGWCLAIAIAAAVIVRGQSLLAPLPLLIAVAACALLPRIAARFAPTRQLGGGGRAMLVYGLAMIPYLAGYLILIRPDVGARAVLAVFTGTIAGVLAFFSPGGLGVRESVATLMAGSSGALVLAGMAAGRVLILLVEAVATIVGLSTLRKREA